MQISVRELVDELTGNGLLDKEQTDSCLQQLGMDIESDDAEAFARSLVERGRLTQFQADELLRKRGQALIIGDYAVLDVIGAGGMGLVYKARHRIMKRLVAVKIMQPTQATNPRHVQRFYREVEVAAKLSHPNIVAAYDAGETSGGLYLAMEYVDGTDMAATVKACGHLEIDQAVNVTLQAARGLAFAHSHNVIHRDIKPSNLLLARDGTVKILDMGLARFTGEPDGDAQLSLTMVGRLIGTVEYMAPEHAANARDADHRSDIYSLGCTMYSLLTGHRPYGGATTIEKVIAQREDPIPLLSDSIAQVPKGLQDVFARMVAKKPEDRYQSMDDAIRDLLVVVPGAEHCDISSLADSEISTPAATDKSMASPMKVAPDGTQPDAAAGGAPDGLLWRWGSQPNKILIASIAALVLVLGMGLLLLLLPSGKDRKLKETETTPVVKAEQNVPTWQAPWKDADAKAGTLAGKQRFGEAMATYEAIAERFSDPKLQERTRDAISTVQSQADAAWRKLEDRSKKLKAEKKFDESRAALTPVLDNFGIPALKEKAEKLLVEIAVAEKSQAEPEPPAWEAAWKQGDAEAQALVGQERFGEGLKTYRDLAKRFKDPKLHERTGKAISNVQGQADAAYRKLEDIAGKSLAEKEFTEGRAALQPVLDRYGIPALKQKAQKLLVEIAVAEKGTTKPPPIQKPPKLDVRWASKTKPAETKVAAWDFRGAAAELAKLKFKEKELTDRLATRRDEVDRMVKLKPKMIERLNQTKPWLQRRSVAVRGPDGVKIMAAGTRVVKADDRGLTVEVIGKDGKKTELRTWQSLPSATVQRFVQLAVEAKSADDQLAAGLLALARNDAAAAQKHFEKARSLGANIDKYLDRLAPAAFARVNELLDKKKFTEAAAALTEIEKKYGKTSWFASHEQDFAAARTQAKGGSTEARAEKLYAQAAKLFEKEELWELKAHVEKLKADYAKTPAVTDTQRKPSLADMAKAVTELGKFLTVRLDGRGDFKGIQAAIDAATPRSLIEIQDNGLYREKLVIPEEKEGLILRGARGSWPVVTSAGRGKDIDVLLKVNARGTTVERLILAHARPAGGTPYCLSVGIRNKGPFRLRAALVFMRGTVGFRTASAQAVVEDSVIVANWDNRFSRISARNCLVRGNLVTGMSSADLRSSTISGDLQFSTHSGVVVVDSILGSASHANATIHQLEYCDLVGGKPNTGGPKLGTGCFSANPQFRDPTNLDYRLRPSSPCRKKASDGGDVGVRYTLEMLGMIKKAQELRKKGIIKF